MSTREELIEAATTQFALNGFEGTTVADVQTAVGLTAGSGALYKHFRSKEDLFAECVRSSLGGLASTGTVEFPQDLEAALRMLGTEGLAQVRRDQQLMRMMLLDGHRFPELRNEFRKGIRTAYRAVAAWLTIQIEAGQIRPVDVRATAAVLIGPIIAYQVTEQLLGEPPAQVNRARFLDGWVDLAIAALTPVPSQ